MKPFIFDDRFTPSVRFEVGVAQTLGARAYQEDQAVALGSFKGLPNLDYFAIFDGHGGSEASAYCSEELHHHLEGIKPTGPVQWTKEFEEAYRKTHRGCVSRYLSMPRNPNIPYHR